MTWGFCRHKPANLHCFDSLSVPLVFFHSLHIYSDLKNCWKGSDRKGGFPLSCQGYEGKLNTRQRFPDGAKQLWRPYLRYFLSVCIQYPISVPFTCPLLVVANLSISLTVLSGSSLSNSLFYLLIVTFLKEENCSFHCDMWSGGAEKFYTSLQNYFYLY